LASDPAAALFQVDTRHIFAAADQMSAWGKAASASVRSGKRITVSELALQGLHGSGIAPSGMACHGALHQRMFAAGNDNALVTHLHRAFIKRLQASCAGDVGLGPAGEGQQQFARAGV
jgi:hypothetical protein